MLAFSKSDNLQYDTLVCCVTGTKDSSTKRLMFKALSLIIISYRLRALKTLCIFLIFVKLLKKNLKRTIFAKNLQEKIILGASDPWSFVPRPSEAVYCIENCRILFFYSISLRFCYLWHFVLKIVLMIE